MAEVARIGRQDLVLTLENEAKAGLRNELGPLINAFHAQTVPMEVSRFALRLHDAQNRLVGGLSGVLNWGWLFIEALWVDPGLRGQGAGRVLMARAERVAREGGCHSAWLDTFQARPFYEAIGYQVFATLEQYPGTPLSRFHAQTPNRPPGWPGRARGSHSGAGAADHP